ncbi:hypothetical protein HYT25_01930 [Candidatus Pacearchaeota archaeon]|nr:hypothetical protein [Candidatus Pacearchaeota archaeon]
MPITFTLSDELISAHYSIKKRDSLLTSYLLTLNDGTTFEIIGGRARQVRYRDSQAILQYEKADDVRKLQSLNPDKVVLLNGELVNLREAYKFIGTDYIPTPRYLGIDDSPEIYSELLSGRSNAMRQPGCC